MRTGWERGNSLPSLWMFGLNQGTTNVVPFHHRNVK